MVYERDEWDLKLVRAANGIDIRLGIFLHLTRLCIWLSRRILWVLMHLGRILSAFMLRQMEFDADSYETKVAGSAAFAQTMAKLHTLAAASQWAHGKMEESWQNRRLPENLPGFINLSVNTRLLEAPQSSQRSGRLHTPAAPSAALGTATRPSEAGISFSR